MEKKTRLISSVRIATAGKFVFTEWSNKSISIEDMRYQSTQNNPTRTPSTLDHATLTSSGVHALATFLQHAS